MPKDKKPFIVFRPFVWFWNTSKKKKTLMLIILLVVGGYWYWSQKNAGIVVSTTEVRKGEVVETISASGEIAALESTSLSFQTGGKLAWVGVQEGDIVKKGQAIASLDKTQLQQTLKKYLNAFDRERTEFDDTSDSADDVTLDDAVRRIKARAQVDLNQALIDVELQNEAIRLANLYTPIAGIVTKAEPQYSGVNVGPTTAVYEIVNPDTVYFQAEVNEVDITKIKSETPVEIELDAYPDEILKEDIYEISFASTTTSTGGTAYTVKLTLPENNDFRYRLGMNGDAEFILSKKENVLLIPQTALVENGDETFVWTVNGDNLAHKKLIKTGTSSIDEVEVLEGISEGEKVVIRPPSTLVEGVKVKNGS